MWARVQGWFWMAGAVLAVLVGAYTAGSRAARRSVQAKQSSAQYEQRGKINDVDSKMAQMDDDDVRRDLAKWVRPTDAEDR